MPKTFLVNGWLCVACYYPTTPTDYPSTARDTSVGPPIAVNIDFCGYLQFLSISFVLIIWVQYATDNLSGQESFCLIGLYWNFNPQWTPEQAIVKASSVRTTSVSWEKCAVTKCLHIYQCLWRGLGSGEVHSGSWMKAWPSRSWSIGSHSSYPNRSEQNSSKLRHTVCDIFRSHSALKGYRTKPSCVSWT